MSRTHAFGVSAAELGWVPTPSYLLRRARILSLTRDWSCGNLLEVGCGSGALLCDFNQRGFECTGLEASPDALDLARLITRGTSIQICAAPDFLEPFDYLLSCEVLEHISDDVEALRTWSTWLKPHGRILISVPAHPQRWDKSDEWAGHFRRYRRKDLLHLMEQCRLKPLYIECYGFPVTRLISLVRAQVHKRQLKPHATRQAQTHQSGTRRTVETKLYPLYSSVVGRVGIAAADWLQKRFLASERGDGYIVIAEKR